VFAIQVVVGDESWGFCGPIFGGAVTLIVRDMVEPKLIYKRPVSKIVIHMVDQLERLLLRLAEIDDLEFRVHADGIFELSA